MSVAVQPLPVPRFPAGSPRSNGIPRSSPDWPVLRTEAFRGLAGHVVRRLQPQTEADPAAMLGTFLCMFGSAVGPGPHARAAGSDHPGRLFAVVVASSSRGRKGTSWALMKQVMAKADPTWSKTHVTSGLASGEGLIAAALEHGPILLVHEGEWAKSLKKADADGSTLSEVIRDAWDTGDLSNLTKTPVRVSGAHISLVGHITDEELGARLSGLQAANGFANRFLFFRSRREGLKPDGGNLDDQDFAELGAKVADALEAAKKVGVLKRNTEAEIMWDGLYRQHAADEPGGVLGGIIARSEAHVLRLSVVYALLDGSRHIDVPHLESASAVWDYCRESAGQLFGGNRLNNPEAERLLAFLEVFDKPVASKKDMTKGCGGQLYGVKLEKAITLLEDRGFVVRVRDNTTGGRSSEGIALIRQS